MSAAEMEEALPMPRSSFDELVAFGVRLLMARQVAEPDARYLSELAVVTEARGVSTHGLAPFGYWDAQIGAGIDAAAKPGVLKNTDATVLIDGNRSFSQLAMRLAKELAADNARRLGIAMVAVRNTSWLGALGVHLVSLAEAGLMAQLWAQTSTCKDCAPIGGLEARFSTNPVALAFPTGGAPMVADFSTAAVSMGRVNQMARGGEKTAAPIFMDREGRLSADPRVVKEGGTILFMGGLGQGHKGYALSLWCEALTAVAGGDCNNPEAETRQCFNLAVLDPQAFAGTEYYMREMQRFLRHLKSSRLRPGSDGIWMPGERAAARLDECRLHGVPVGEEMLARLNALAAKCGIPPLSPGAQQPH